jgi:hypothetical protein
MRDRFGQMSGFEVYVQMTAGGDMKCVLWPALVCVFLETDPIQAQPHRYELGQRVRVFEETWEEAPGEDARRRCVAPLKRAVIAFFAQRYSEAGCAVDLARFALAADFERTPAALSPNRWLCIPRHACSMRRRPN